MLQVIIYMCQIIKSWRTVYFCGYISACKYAHNNFRHFAVGLIEEILKNSPLNFSNILQHRGLIYLITKPRTILKTCMWKILHYRKCFAITCGEMYNMLSATALNNAKRTNKIEICLLLIERY